MANKRRKLEAGVNAPAEKARSGEKTAPTRASVASRVDPPSSDRSPPPPPGNLLARVWANAKAFSGVASDSTLLWPRWLVLRAVGVVYLFVFAGIAVEGKALLGPTGISAAGTYLAQVKQLGSGGIAAFVKAPSLFWLDTSAGMIGAVAGIGLLAAIALVANLWPRMALAVCWLAFLSFVTTWAEFSPAQLDGLMLEVALLCIPFAPRGLRPGLGADSPPRPIAVFMMRWMLFRIMVESGVVKLISTDPHWRNLTAMDVMYETSPSPTVLGYWVHQLPHPYHVFEIAFTFAAELLAPALAVFGGRRGRWIALGLWTALQAGIQLTCNFGWLNTAALGLGLLLLDDQMIAAAVEKLRLPALRRFFVAPFVPAEARPVPAWARHALRAALGLHFSLTVYHFATACGVVQEPALQAGPRVVRFFDEFRSANGYRLYANFEAGHFQIDFEGSNDAGRTWRTYETRHLPQRVDQRPPFTAPYFPRFETAVQIESSKPPGQTFLVLTAAHLLAQNPEVLKLFARDPFPERPPTVVRMRRYELEFTDPATLRRTGHYWKKTFVADYAPAMYVTEQGGIAQFNLDAADAALGAGNYAAALAAYERDYKLGNLDAGYRLADVYSRGLGVREDPARVFTLFSDLAGRGEPKAVHNVGLCYEHGIGVPADVIKAGELYQRAAEQGNLLSLYALGRLSAEDRRRPRDDVQGLSFLLRALARATGDDAAARFIREDQPRQAKRLMERLSAEEIARARALAAAAR